MSSLIQPRPLDGPFTYHVYIGGGGSPELSKLNQDLIDCGITTYTKFNSGGEEVTTRITEGIDRSRKCLINLTKQYLIGDLPDRELETSKIASKASRFSKDMIILLVNNEISDAVPKQFSGYS